MNYHDGKTDHTSPQNYIDMEGQSRTFTMVDHDKKTKISVPSSTVDTKTELKNYREKLINRILSSPAVYCPVIFSEYTLRGELQSTIDWNEKMLSDEGTSLQILRDLSILLSNNQISF